MTLRPALLALMLSLVLVGCSDSPEESQGTGNDDAPATSASADPEDADLNVAPTPSVSTTTAGNLDYEGLLRATFEDAGVIEAALADLRAPDGSYPDDLLAQLNTALEDAGVAFRIGQIDPTNVTAACYVSGERYLTNNQIQGNFAYLLGRGGCSYEERDAEVVLNLTFAGAGAEVTALTPGQPGQALASTLEELVRN